MSEEDDYWRWETARKVGKLIDKLEEDHRGGRISTWDYMDKEKELKEIKRRLEFGY